MYSDKQNVLQLVALLKAHNISNVVLCPGSRNTPLIQTFSNCKFFNCYSITDERSAAFYAMGLSLQSGKPTVVCCTSGTALLNMHPAVAEAFYQNVPLIIISADRPQAWIGQMDGQTLPQPHIFGKLVKKSVDLSEIHNEEDIWYCNRLVNEALLELDHHGKGPVHINIQLSEPLFNFSVSELPKSIRVITRYQGLNIYDKSYDDLIKRLNKYPKKMMLVGQMSLIYLFEKKTSKLIYKHFAWLSEHLSNKTIPGQAIQNFDAIISCLSEEEMTSMSPDLLITYGGHIISKRVKKLLRKHPPKEHWHVSKEGEIVDTFGVLNTIIEIDPFEFIEKIAHWIESSSLSSFPQKWESFSKSIPTPSENVHSSLKSVGMLLQNLPDESVVHLANSSAVRYAQLFKLPENTEVCCNRGTNGIDGSLSTAIGYAWNSDKLNFIIIGDLSFFYDMNALGIQYKRKNLRILLLNNGGGSIFNNLPNLQLNETNRKFITGQHTTKAKGWAEECGFDYISIHNLEELENNMPLMLKPEIESETSILMEIFTNSEIDAEAINNYYKELKNNRK